MRVCRRDWRLPNVKELQSIVNYEVFEPAVSPAFDTDCPGATVLTGSCTAATCTHSQVLQRYQNRTHPELDHVCTLRQPSRN
jgi:hypothetical protein